MQKNREHTGQRMFSKIRSLYEYKGGWEEVFDQTKGVCFNLRFQYNSASFQFQ